MLLRVDRNAMAALRQLSRKTRVPASVYVREAVDMLLAKYARDAA
jgi:hypothetical protein